ncbi:MAG: S8 family peptidase [Bacteroidia bacterium]|nr:S8 family peptidase [Bacteroidia bacterium]
MNKISTTVSMVLGTVLFCLTLNGQSISDKSLSVLKQLSNSPIFKHIDDPLANTTEKVQVLIKGDIGKIKNALNGLGGSFKYNAGDIVRADVPINKLKALKNNPNIEQIQYLDNSKNKPLADSMRVQANIDSIYAGLGELLQGYDGTGVVIGMIDYGIDYDHADFKDAGGNTRIKYFWDTDQAGTAPAMYGYGNECDSTEIALGTCGATKGSHGTTTTGIAAGNGSEDSTYRGVAPGVDIIMVDVASGNLTDACNYIFAMADSLGKPCIINVSTTFESRPHDVLIAGNSGAHDGSDLASLALSNLLNAKKGRALVCAAGNDGNYQPFHLGYNVEADSSFTWFRYNGNTLIGQGLFFELWADTNNFKGIQYCLGMDKVNGGYSFRGKTPYHSVSDNLNANLVDSIKSKSGNFLAKVNFWMELKGDKYFMQMYAALGDIDSSQYHFRWMTKGSGTFDVWSYDSLSYEILELSEIVPSTEIPDSATFPEIVRYKAPDVKKSILSGFTSSPDVLSIGIYNSKTATVGELAAISARGYNLKGDVKPDVCAPAGSIMSPNVGGGYTSKNGATSYSSPVVAGIAALYLDKYPTASYKDINRAIRMSATEDSFTGTTPNTDWGYGKVDGYRALTMFAPTLTPTATATTICNGDSTTLSTTGSINYWWAISTAASDTIASNTSIIVTPGVTSTYILTGVDTNGFSKKDSIWITVDPLPSVMGWASEDTICWGDSTILYANGADLYWWDDAAWDSIGTGDTLVVWPDSSTVYYVSGKDSNGCWNEDTVWVTVQPIPSVMGWTSEDTICWGESITLYASGADWYWWDDAAWDSIGVGDTIVVWPDSSTAYYISGQDSNGCWNGDTVWITVLATPAVTSWASEDTICGGDSTILYVSGDAVVYWWDDAAWDSLGMGDSIIVWPDSSTIYYITSVGANGCVDVDSIWIKVYPVMNLIATTSRKAICPGDSSLAIDSVSLSATGANSYIWTNSDGDTLGTSSSMKVLPDTTTTYYVAAWDSNGCGGWDMVTVTVRARPILALSLTDDDFCQGQSTYISLASDAVYFLLFDPNWMYLTSTTFFSPSFKVIPDSSMRYYIIAAYADSCFTIDSVDITVKPSPIVDLGKDTICTTCAGIVLDAGNTGNIYSWSTGATTQTVTVGDTGKYTVTVTGSNGCTGYDEITVNYPTGIGDCCDANNGKIIVYPNPYTNRTKINYELTKNGKIEITVFDILGNKVHTLVNEYQTIGTYFYDFSAKELGYASGVYILRMSINDDTVSVTRLMESGK